MQTTIDRYAVLGNPIAHSQSPLIHRIFAHQTHQTLQYDALLIGTAAGEFAQAVKLFQATGGKGLNITVPFKQMAWSLAEQRTERADQAGAVNTLWFDESGRLHGDNTDGVGLIRDLVNHQSVHLTGQCLLILGAGGAVRGVLAPLLENAPARCVIANRTVAKAQELINTCVRYSLEKWACDYAALAGHSFDLIINGTATSLQGELPPLPAGLVAPGGRCYDMMYAATPTPFMRWAVAQGAAAVTDGLGMLVEQAAESFCRWRGVMPNTAPVIQQVRQHLQSLTH